MKKLFALSALSILLANCGTEGSGNFTVQGAGSATSVASVYSSISDNLTPFQSSSDDLLPVGSGVNSTELQIKVHQFWISTSGDCSNPILVADEPDAEFQNILTTGEKPTFGQGQVSSGSYQCVIMVMNDTIKFTPVEDVGSGCTAGVEEEVDVCGVAGGGSFVHPDGSDYSGGTCSAANDTVAVYLSNWAAAVEGSDGANAFAPPTSNGDTANGFALTGALEVGQSSVNSFFVVNGDGKVEANGADCDMQAPDFSFYTP